MGLKSVAKNFGETLNIELLIDASATVGICNRSGLGKLKHVEVEDLWLQGVVKEKKVKLQKIARVHNVADMMTKSLSRKEALRQLKLMGIEIGGDRPRVAPALASIGCLTGRHHSSLPW